MNKLIILILLGSSQLSFAQNTPRDSFVESKLSKASGEIVSVSESLIDKNCKEEMIKKEVENNEGETFLRYVCSRGLIVQHSKEGSPVVDILHYDAKTKLTTSLMKSETAEVTKQIWNKAKMTYQANSLEYKKEQDLIQAKKQAALDKRNKEKEYKRKLIESLLN